MKPIAPVSERVTLYCRAGSSDKVYEASIEPKGRRFVVNVAYGRRGSTLRTGTKTSIPVDYENAKKILDKLIREKLARGYAEAGKRPQPARTAKKPKQSYNWKKEHTRLWNKLVPAQGQAATLQGELIRIAGKLTDQAYRNGNCNWDADHERMWRFVGQHLHDPEVFSTQQRKLIREKIDEIIRDRDTPDLSGDGSCYYLIMEKVVDWCMVHPAPIPHQKDRKLKR